MLRSEKNSIRYNGFAEDRPLPVVSILKLTDIVYICLNYNCFQEGSLK